MAVSHAAELQDAEIVAGRARVDDPLPDPWELAGGGTVGSALAKFARMRAERGAQCRCTTRMHCEVHDKYW